MILRDRAPLVPVTLTWTTDTEMNVHDNLTLPEPVTLEGESVHDDVLFVVRVTIAVKPLKPVTVIVELPFTPTFTDTLVGLATTEKSAAELT
jgi:Flp pilus assembly protein TadG